MPEPLLVVDVQRGFINEYTRHVPGRIRRLIETGAYSPASIRRLIRAGMCWVYWLMKPR